VKVNRRFGGTADCCLLYVGLLLGLLGDTEDGGGMFLRNIDDSQDYTAVTSQKKERFIAIAVITSNPTKIALFV
jgi:hypothetical protein